MAHTTLLEPVRLDECNCGDPDKPDVGRTGAYQTAYLLLDQMTRKCFNAPFPV